MKEDDVVIVSAVRTAIGKYGGSLRNETPQGLAAIVIRESIRRAGIADESVDQVILGWTRQTTEASNIARHAALKAGLPESILGYTVHRQCTSGLQAVFNAFQEIKTGNNDVVVAGGTEVLSAAPFYLKKARFGYFRGDGVLKDSLTESGMGAQPPEIYGEDLSMGITAENLAEKYNVSRESQDQFAYESQQKAAKAIETKKFKDEIIPVTIKASKELFSFEQDEHARLNTTMVKLAALKPVFKEGGTVTAGNSSGQNDAAAALAIMSYKKAVELKVNPLARIISGAAAGVDPRFMGISPVPATQLALKRAGIDIDDIDLFELNEAFASQCLATLKGIPIPKEKLNVNGGAIALGHPVGATGAIILTKLIYEMQRRKNRYGLVTLCGGGGQGLTLIVESIL
ncbi:MAG: thiolase family protein [Candidatus Theseobacter exili]|nr:thiolase family protein [Candidatus Theseobacter exili]